MTEIKSETFNDCSRLEKVVLPNNLKEIHNHAFNFCQLLKEINIPNSVEHMGECCFHYCNTLKNVKLPDNLKVLGDGAFSECVNLVTVNLPQSLISIGKLSFNACKKLKSINLPQSLKEINEEAFLDCVSLNEFVVPEGVEKIEAGAFKRCSMLKNIALPNTLKEIKSSAFSNCKNLKKIVIPDNVTVIGNDVFDGCYNMEQVTLSKNLKYIGKYAFCECNSLSSIIIPDSVVEIGDGAFLRCYSLSDVVLSSNLENVPHYCFDGCYKLEKIVIPKSVKEIGEKAFSSCNRMKDVYLYSTIKKIYKDSFGFRNHLNRLSINDKERIIEVDMQSFGFCENDKNNLLLGDLDNKGKYIFCYNDDCIQFDVEKICNNKKSVNVMIKKGLIKEKNYISLYYWLDKKFIPSHTVIKNMPIMEINNFFVNNNYLEWNKIISKTNIDFDYEKDTVFKMCYILGVFNESAKIRDRAIQFITEKIIPTMSKEMIHSKFEGVDLENGYNNDFSEFFMKYYDNEEFLIIEDEDENKIDMTVACYNNFNKVKKFYPSKTIHTNRDADLLLPGHVISAIRSKEYENVDVGNLEFSRLIGIYGYSQEQFEKLQNWYNEGKNIKQMKLFINEDGEEKGITYKLLNKDNLICAVLGNITNCCQVVGGQGESCVKYGMTMPNSSFITFNYEGKIIGQAWVWYDEERKIVCLDNIEVPNKYLDKIEHNKEIQDNFIECLLRIEENFKKTMQDKGFKVDNVTVGSGFNDLKKMLSKKFKLISNAIQLKDYNGYSDAYDQYIIKKNQKNIK